MSERAAQRQSAKREMLVWGAGDIKICGAAQE